jgi:hypothetical protein
VSSANAGGEADRLEKHWEERQGSHGHNEDTHSL